MLILGNKGLNVVTLRLESLQIVQESFALTILLARQTNI